MAGKILDLFIDQGADYDKPIEILDDSGNPDNLTGATAVMQIRRTYDDGSVLALTTADSSLTIDGLAGTITPHLSRELTAALPAGAYLYDIRMLESNGRTTYPRRGKFTVNPAVTVINPPAPSPAPEPPDNVYVAEDGVTPYTAEDGATYYTQES